MMNMTTTATSVLGATAVFLLSGYSSCDPIIENNGFDLWCGDQLCNWAVDKGSVERVPTWHKDDQGVELIGDTAAISQVSDVTSTDVQCVKFSLVADIAATADVTLQMDFFDDGTVEYIRPIPTASWAPVTYLVTLPVNYQGIRFRIAKDGPGRVALAQILAESSDECVDSPLAINDLPDGATCATAGDCASGVCATEVASFGEPLVCSECEDDAGCGVGDVCGAEVAPDRVFLDFYRGCGAPARHGLGERCVGDGECTTGICCDGMCSTCCDDGDCTGGQSCTRRDRADDLQFWWAPYQCGPAVGGSEAGQSCLIDGDCAAGVCTGTGDFKVCLLDGRLCGTDADCPTDLACVAIGTTSGTCQ